jgi:hypothetical protein
VPACLLPGCAGPQLSRLTVSSLLSASLLFAEDSEESSSEEEEEPPQRAAPAPRRKKGEEELDPEQMRVDMERLALIRKKR